MKKALIVGISGQDGTYLADLLIKKDYEVYGTSRDAELKNFYGLQKLGILKKVKLFSMSLIDFRSVMQVILQIRPDEIYNLAGQSSVGLSFLQPVETLESIIIGTINILEVIRFNKLNIKYYNACSSECFGDTNGKPANEMTLFQPKSPYAVSKSTAFWLVSNYRDSYKLFACSGILFNHESPLRPNRFVTKKIIETVCSINMGEKKKLELGNTFISRDWGWAPDYVEAMYLMMQSNKPEDFVIATGVSTTLEEFIRISFDYFNLNYKEYLQYNDELLRPSDIKISVGDPSKAKTVLGWQPKLFIKEIINQLIEDQLTKST